MSDEVVERPGPVDNSARQPDIAARNERVETEKTAVQEVQKVEAELAAQDVENPEGSATSDDGKPQKGGKKGLNERFSELTNKAKEAAAEATREREQRLALEARLKELEAPKPQQPKVEPKQEASGPPTLMDCDFDQERHARALDEYYEKKIESKWAAKEQEKAKQARFQTYQQRADEFSKEHPDYAQKVEALQVHPATLEAIMETDMEPQLAYYLANNPAEARAIAEMTIAGQARAIGKLEAKLSTPAAPEKPVSQPKPVTKAPAPVTTVSGSPAVVKDVNEMTMSEYAKHRAEERRAKGLPP